jgi:CMP-N-acetylneuraminic acid synthetase
MSERVVALLPMKANSERVKGKNFRDFNGRPLFSWILDSLLSIQDIDLVVINTDARGILAAKGLVESDRVVIRDRRPELCGDMVSMNLILADDLANVPADIYVMTHTTNPLLSAETIKAALDKVRAGIRSGKADSLFTVTRFQTRFYKLDGTPINHDPQQLLRTQDLEPWFEENSNLYIFTLASFTQTKARIGRRAMLYETPRLEAIDIDTESDWQLAEVIAQNRRILSVGSS